MADEILYNPRKKLGLIEKVAMGVLISLSGVGVFNLGYNLGKSANPVKSVEIRDVNNDYKEDIVMTYENGVKDAFIKQDNSHLSWNDFRKKLYDSADETVKKIESEINK